VREEATHAQAGAGPAPAKGEAVEDAVRRWQWAPTNGGLSENRRIATALLQSGIDVRADYNPKIFHLKFILRDYRPGRGKRTKPSAALLSGSTNFTVTGTHANLNHVFVFHDTRICAEYRLQYDEVEQGEFGRRGLGAVPRCHNLNGVPVKVLFAPDNVPSRR
jgi:phosphatidylserine/phosphatidylglycerophosphate/cardiolipin synthase-like enzyme